MRAAGCRKDAIVAELTRITGSSGFRGADRMRRFLEYLVMETVEGRGPQIKEYSVALQVFDKPSSFDPKADSTVRSEASKLRNRLRLYYEMEGSQDPVVISIPKGGYIAEWHERGGTGNRVLQKPKTRYIAAVVIAIVFAIAAAVGWSRFHSGMGRKPFLRRLTNDTLASHPAIARDGNLIVYSSDRAGRGDLDLWLQPVSGREPLRLTDDPADDFEPAISPDGSLIAFRSDRQPPGIYVIPALGGEPRLLAAGGRRPHFSPDGSRIAYSFSNSRYFLNVKGSGSAFVVPVAGGEPRPIAPDFSASYYPIYTSDGRHILFVGHQDMAKPPTATFDWWIVHSEGGRPLKTGVMPVLMNSGLVSPDELHPISPEAWLEDAVVFAARSGDETNLWRIRLSPAGVAPGNPERITLGAGLEMQPSASKSGRLVFTTAVPNGDVFAIPVDAETGISKGPMYAIAPSPGFDGWPSITHDGKRLAFASGRLVKLGLFVHEIDTARVSAIPAGENLRSWSEISTDGESIVYHTATTPDGKFGSNAWQRAITGGPPRQLCKNCFFMGRTRDQQTILFTNLSDRIRIIRRNTLSGAESDYISHPKWSVLQPNLSPDERWIAFYVRISPDRARIYLAPWDSRATVPESEWIAVTDGTSDDTTPVWSPGGRILYFASDRDGVTCIYGQRISATTGMEGPPFSVRHLHAAAERAANAGVAHRGFGVAKDKLVLTIARRSGNIWLLE